MKADARMPFEFIATRLPMTVEPATVVGIARTSRASPMDRTAFLGVAGSRSRSSSFAAQKTPMYGLPLTSRRRSNRVPQSSGRETTADPSSNLMAFTRTERGGCSRPRDQMNSLSTSSMKIRSGLRCCFTYSRIALIARGARSVREAAHAARSGTTRIRSSSSPAMASHLQLVAAPAALLGMPRELSLRALHDPGRDAPVRLDAPQEPQLLRVGLVLRHGQRL